MFRTSTVFMALLFASACLGNDGRGFTSTTPFSATANVQPIVSPVVLHRLNNLEYDNTVRDLFGTTLTPAKTFPADAVTDGFDNMAASLSMTPALIGLYNQAAQTLADDALDPQPRSSVQFNAATYGNAGNGFMFGASWSLTSNLSFPLTQAQDDTVTITIDAGGSAVGAPTPILAVTLDDAPLKTFTVTAAANALAALTITTTIKAGTHKVGVAITNFQASNSMDGTGNQLIIGTVSVVSTTQVTSPRRANVYPCDPATSPNVTLCWQKNVLTLAQRAWRRPLTDEEQTAVLAVWQSASSGGANDAAFKVVIQAVLMSSKFLFRPSDAMLGNVGTGAPLDDYALANRLSYFLWASMPDATLLSDANQGVLRTESGLRSEVARMLADPRASGLQTGFAAQWLNVRALAGVAPDPNLFPSWDANLVPAMTSEAQLVFADFLQNKRPLTDILAPGFTYLNDRLAVHYGLPAPGSAVPVRVAVPNNERGGLLTQGAMLVTTSQSNRTSPVQRGLWVLEQLLCQQLAAPANVPALPPSVSNGNQVITMRAQMAAHLTDPSCNACHNVIDPLGFGLEAFDGIGAMRTTEAGQPVDTSGQFPGGVTFSNASEMAKGLQTMPQFSACAANKLYSYALGRSATSADAAFLQDIVTTAGADATLDGLIVAVVLSPPFRLVNTTGAAP